VSREPLGVAAQLLHRRRLPTLRPQHRPDVKDCARGAAATRIEQRAALIDQEAEPERIAARHTLGEQ
jgi:hypothetical protein